MAEYRHTMLANAFGLEYSEDYAVNIWNPRNS